MSTQAPAVQSRPTAWSTVGAYVALTKPRIIELLLVTTLPTMVVAKHGLPSVWLMAATLVGGTLAAGGANAGSAIRETLVAPPLGVTSDPVLRAVPG